MNGDLLKLAAKNFEPLLNKKITIELGRKGEQLPVKWTMK